MKNISIIGGTGMLGAPVAREFARRGFAVKIITRNAIAACKALGADFEYLEGDLFQASFLSEALADCDGLHINMSGQCKATYYKNHVVATQRILQAISHRPPECISMISSASVYPEQTDRWDTLYKLEAERLLIHSGIPYLVFMPSWFMESLPLFIQDGKLIQIGPSVQPIHWLAAQDYARLVVDCFQNPRCRNQRLPIYGPEGITMHQALAAFSASREIPLQKMPVWLAKVFGKLTGDDRLIDVADLLVHYEKWGEKDIPNALRTHTTLSQWISHSIATAEPE
ncbi:SDR family oxidoreductase [Simiduia agarivorans]|uniref:Nmra family protein n=1 Tax=Simiduia agarivorans (strain DSM 21679 / JCM 13881 / BCRC 17597 / SA1) TaxID=1117647 RepID=K4KJ84_SIMAS|nr:NAD(P)H-binding protein [Simiduia agarivorans]AFU98250.1 nmra family protein [Simiduia agarivorans SA1 = DSM 21679]